MNYLGEKSYLWLNEGIIPLTVDYDISLQDAIKAGKYGMHCFNTHPEPIEWHDRREESDVGKQDVRSKIWRCDEGLSSKQRSLPDFCRPANLREMLAFGAQYPHMQLLFRIFALNARPHFGHELIVYLFLYDTVWGRAIDYENIHWYRERNDVLLLIEEP